MDQPDGSAIPTTEAAVPGAAPARPAPVASSDRVPVPVWVIAAVFVAVELAVSGRYGFQQDELYFIEAGRHLAFGYVDQPPLAPLLTRITDIFGVSPTAVRVIPALVGGALAVAAAKSRRCSGRAGSAGCSPPLLLRVLPSSSAPVSEFAAAHA